MAMLGLKMVSGAVHHLWDRAGMKKRDEEIDQERVRERVREANSNYFQHHAISIKHFTHNHPLRKVHLDETFECGSCKVPSSGGWAYVCEEADCTYRLHEVCSTNPVVLRPAMKITAPTIVLGVDPRGASISTFAHRSSDHPVKDVYSNLEFQCDHCFTNGKGRRYKCAECDVNLHPVCAKHPTKLSTFMHPRHELELRTKKRFRTCQICRHSIRAGQKSLNLRVYGCKECKFWVHPMCSQLPQYLLHDLHVMGDPPHPLQLKWVESAAATIRCDANCGSNCTTGWQYVCDICSVSFHIECILHHSVKDHSSVHDNPETRLPKMLGVFLELADVAAGQFGVLDIATSLV